MQNIHPFVGSILIAFASAATLGAQAQSTPAGAASVQGTAPSASATLPTSEGEVRKVDKEQGKLTLKHGPIANLAMPGMTMVFKVADPKALGTLKAGDKVRFLAEKVNGALTVTAIEAVK